jgi:hypothetical protein
MNRIAVIVVAVALVAGCSEPLSTREKGALIGGGIGAGTGAVVGSAVGHTGAGALIGAGVGVVSGAVIGDAVQAKQRQAAQATPPVAIASLPRGALHAHIGRPGFCPPGQGKKGRC